MPRKKYVPKCSYCRRTTFTDPIFLRVLWCFLTGVPAVETTALLKTLEPPVDVTEKTVRRHYRLIANKIHDKWLPWLFDPSDKMIALIDKMIALTDRTLPEVSKPKDEALRAEARRNCLYETWHDQWIHPENDSAIDHPLFGYIVRQNQDLPFADLDIAVMYRELSKRKFGITGSIKENLTLAAIRSIAKYHMDEHKTKGWSMSEQTERRLFEAIAQYMRLDPC